jgi:hypothetical protein
MQLLATFSQRNSCTEKLQQASTPQCLPSSRWLGIVRQYLFRPGKKKEKKRLASAGPIAVQNSLSSQFLCVFILVAMIDGRDYLQAWREMRNELFCERTDISFGRGIAGSHNCLYGVILPARLQRRNNFFWVCVFMGYDVEALLETYPVFVGEGDGVAHI